MDKFSLTAQMMCHYPEYLSALDKVIRQGRFILGEEVSFFEEEFARYIGTGYGVGVASGTDALILALQACGIAAGDRVWVTSFGSVAPVVAIQAVGATPNWLDVDEHYNLDLNFLEKQLKNADDRLPEAIIVVHLFGLMVEMDSLCQLLADYSIKVIEDCSQAHGAEWKGKKAGSWGDASVFSFYPTKNLGALGDGGIVLSSDESLIENTRLLRQYGWRERYISEIKGHNSRLDEIQAAFLRVRLKYLEEENRRRITLAQIYENQLDPSRLVKPLFASDRSHVYHQYVVRCENRDGLRDYLRSQSIPTQIHYPVPVHRQPAYLDCPAESPLMNSDRFACEVLSLPILPSLSDQDVMDICSLINQYN